MVKPRVIIADEDYNYLSSFVSKFTSDYYDKLELEVVTEREYFKELFSTAQNIDVLIVAEELYSPEIKKHNIKSLFVLVKEDNEGETGELDVTRLFKYSSLKEIFNQIVGKSGSIFTDRVTEEKDAKIILFTSSVGGAGKTTVAMGVAANLAMNYKRVLYINAQQLQTFQFKLQDSSPIADYSIYSGLLEQREYVYRVLKKAIRKEVFDYVPAFRAAISSLGIEPSLFSRLASEARDSGDYDYIIVDTDSSFSDEKLELLDDADYVFIVTTQEEDAAASTEYMVRNINGVNSDKYTFICNKYQPNKPNAMTSTEVKYSYSVSEYINWMDSLNGNAVETLAQNNEMKKISFLVM